MLLDILCSDNYEMFNVKLAKVVGLQGAVYINVLLNIQQKATKKEKLEEGYILLDRKYVKERTSIDEDVQRELDENLSKLRLIHRKDDDRLFIDVEALSALTLEEDEGVIKDINEVATRVKKAVHNRGMTQRQRQAESLKGYLVCSNLELLNAYKGWVDGVYANPKGFLSKRAIEIFQRGVDDFAKGDLDLALKIVEIATVNGYRNVDWAIELFNKDYARDFFRQYVDTKNAEPVRIPKRVATGESF